ncbi:MAG TPA: DUF3592 domain-containing protein [Propionibacteriaceae bacterium]|nr:DUF3592 domain-containing protein [Propionibacteriaceae bacterium]
MKALKIVGIVLGILLLLTGGGLAAGSVLANKGQAAFQEELTNSGYDGPVEGTVQSVSQSNPIVVTVNYTDSQGKQQTGQGAFAGGQPPQVGDTVSTYYNTSNPSQVVVVNLPGLGDLSAIANALRTAAISCLIVGSVLLLAGILGLALGKKQPAAGPPGPMYPTGPPQQPPAGYPAQPYPPQQPPPGQGYPPQQPGQPYPPQQYPGQQYPPQQYPGQQYPPQQYPPEQ